MGRTLLYADPFVCLCDKTYPGEIPHSCLLIPNSGSITDQNKDVTEVQLGEPMTLIRVAYRNMGEGLLTGMKMTQTAASLKSIMGDSLQNLGPYANTSQPADSSTGWTVFLPVPELVPHPHSRAGFCFFRTAGL